MLSILIPVCNYDVLPLVKELKKQCEDVELIYEIIVLDDYSTLKSDANTLINQLSNCTFSNLKTNIGRSAIRNLLAKKSQFENLLFLDADTFPFESNFISNYISRINNDEKVIYGGILYQREKPSKENLLRWKYGIKREALSCEQRSKKPYLSFLTLNFLIKKSVFDRVCFNETIPNLRHEDTLFSYDLMQEKVIIEHIDNAVYHLGLESSTAFLKKSEEAVIGLNYLNKNLLLPYTYTALSTYQQKLNKVGLNIIIRKVFSFIRPFLKSNLLGTKPSLFIFDLYRLGHCCTLKN